MWPWAQALPRPATGSPPTRHGTSSTCTSGGQPHLFVAAGPTPFLHFSLDIEAPVHVMSEATPADWPLAPSGNNALCASQADRSQLDAFMSQMPDEADWRTRFSGQPGR